MKINRMDKRLLEINQIKDIISIDYKDIYYDGNQEKRILTDSIRVLKK